MWIRSPRKLLKGCVEKTSKFDNLIRKSRFSPNWFCFVHFLFFSFFFFLFSSFSVSFQVPGKGSDLDLWGVSYKRINRSTFVIFWRFLNDFTLNSTFYQTSSVFNPIATSSYLAFALKYQGRYHFSRHYLIFNKRMLGFWWLCNMHWYTRTKHQNWNDEALL